MPVTNSTHMPGSGSVFIPSSSNNQPATQRPLQRTDMGKSSLDVGSIENSCFSYISQCLKAIAQWFRGIMHRLFDANTIEPEVVAIKQVTPEQLEERIQMGRQWVESTVNTVIQSQKLNSFRVKSVIEISYKGMKAFSYPTSHPVEGEQFKNDVMAKLEALVRSPLNAEDNRSEGARLAVKIHFFHRYTRPDGTVLPVFHTGKCNFQDFVCGSHGTIGMTPERIEDDQLRSWLDRSFLPQSVADRDNIINYVFGLMSP